MASAVLPSRNEPYWGERKVYMRKYTDNSSSNKPHFNNFNQTSPNFNPNPNPDNNPSPVHVPSRKIHDAAKSNPWKNDKPPSRAAPAAVAAKRNDVHDGREYTTFNLAEYSRAEMRGLERRLRAELEQVRRLRAQIENEELVYRSGCFGSQYSAGGGAAVPPPRPPQLQVDLALPPQLQVDFALDPSAAGLSNDRRTPKGNPNNKKASGTKRAVPFASGRDPKRQAASDLRTGKLFAGMMRRCDQILVKLMKHRHGWVFNVPVDAVSLGLHDYHRIIKRPMDLGTVKSRLSKKEYGSPLDFASDVRLTFDNAMTYNLKGSDVYIMAETLRNLFEEMFGPAYTKFEAERRCVLPAQVVDIASRSFPFPEPMAITPKNNAIGSLPMPEPMPVAAKRSEAMPVRGSLPNSPPVNQVGGGGVTPRSGPKLPKPKARDPNKRGMSFEEKAKLGLGLQNLPAEKMDAMLEIVRKRNSHMAPEGDEIELDIEALDVETLWELDRFVGNQKKAENKLKRLGPVNNTSPVREPMPEAAAVVAETAAVAQKSRKGGDLGEEDVDIGEYIPVNNFPPVEIEKDVICGSRSSNSSSSSGSSSDSSSSSGSDSGSSSGSDESEEDSVQSPFIESKGGVEASVT